MVFINRILTLVSYIVNKSTISKEYVRKDGTRLVMVATRIAVEERRKLRILAAELGLSVQELVRKLIRGTGNG